MVKSIAEAFKPLAASVALVNENVYETLSQVPAGVLADLDRNITLALDVFADVAAVKGWEWYPTELFQTFLVDDPPKGYQPMLPATPFNQLVVLRFKESMRLLELASLSASELDRKMAAAALSMRKFPRR